MKAGLCIAFIMLGCAAVSAAPAYRSVPVNIDGIEYRIISDKKEGMKESEILHPVLLSAREEILNRYGVVFPERQEVTVACGAHIFRRLSGLSSTTAAAYIPGKDALLVQRPSALLKKGILDQVVRHEMLHYAIACSRRKSGIADERCAELFWLEESFCTAACPAGFYDAAKGKKITAGLGDGKKIKKYLEQFLRSENERERAEAYASALSFGTALIAKHGIARVFAAAAGTEDLSLE